MNGSMSDKEILDDVLSSQKHISGVYNTFSNECVNQTLKDDFLNILREEQSIEYSVFSDMQKRGWYSPPSAQPQMINETKTKFENIATQL